MADPPYLRPVLVIILAVTVCQIFEDLLLLISHIQIRQHEAVILIAIPAFPGYILQRCTQGGTHIFNIPLSLALGNFKLLCERSAVRIAAGSHLLVEPLDAVRMAQGKVPFL
ncbi:hypothetical protein D3C71_1932990 [compost metagenome]